MINDVLQAAETLFKDQLTIAYKSKTLPVSVKQHGGQFGDAEIEKIVVSQPSILLTVLNWSRLPNSKHLPNRPYMVNFAAVIAAVDGDPVQRRSQLVVLAGAVTRLLENQYWDISGNEITAAELTASRNLYSLAAQKKGLSLWVVTWSHEMRAVATNVSPTLYLLEAVDSETDVHGSLDNTLEMAGSTEAQHGNLQDELNV